MVRVLIVFESMFGNTRTIAEAIAEGLPRGFTPTVVEVGAAPSLIDETVNLLVVGGPTHAFSMSRPATRRSAAEKTNGAPVSTGDGVREWLASTSFPHGLLVATFDTRVRRPRVPGSAARAIARRLRRLGGHLVTSPCTFWVRGTPGPLHDDEVERARRWGAMLGAAAEPAAGDRAN